MAISPLLEEMIMAIPSTTIATPTDAVEAATESVAQPANYTMEVTKTVQGKNGAPAKREPIGKVQFYVPSLKDFGIDVDPTSTEADGALVYADLANNFLYKSVLAQVKAINRNYLKSGSDTVEMKAGAKFPTNLTELVTPSENTSTVLADRRALISLFADWLANSELMAKRPDGLKLLLKTFLEKPDTLVVQPADKRAQIGKFFEAFGGAVDDKLNEYQGDYLLNVISKCNAEEEDFSFDI